MGGGLMQLVAYGAQDIYLTGNPQITFFKVVYRRHTNFSMESIEQTFNGNPDFVKKVSCTISRNGDLIHRVYVQTTLPSVVVATNPSNSTVMGMTSFNWTNWVGHQLVKNVEVEIGGQRIDKHYGEWLHLWNELSQSPGLQSGYARMLGNVPLLTQAETQGTLPDTTLYIPLEFWFCRNPGLALPLIALQYHEVKINVEFSDLSKCVESNGGSVNNSSLSLKNTSLFVDYIYLDTDERRRFAQVSHEYLIEQLQYTGEESIASAQSKVKLNFNHPVKELVWVVQCNDVVVAGEYFNYSSHRDSDTDLGFSGHPSDALGTGLTSAAPTLGGNPTTTLDTNRNAVVKAKLQLNGHDRFQEREGDYFNYVQPYQHHTNVPALGINVYSFGLKPEEHQPSGTCNFSRIDNAVLQLSVDTLGDGSASPSPASKGSKVRVYATNYNVLRIMSGMGGLAYSN